MNLIALLFLGVVVGSNNLAVALALGAMGQNRRLHRVMLVFGLFEFLVPLVGIWLGATTARAIGLQMDIVGVVLIFGLGLLAVAGGVRGRRKDEWLARLVTNWGGLLVMAAGLSLDNLVLGFSLGLGEARPLVVASAICFFSVLFTWMGMRLGHESRRHWERLTKLGSGVLLMGLGVATGMDWF
jgi:manganese efflux pump family protein